ncbi:MAG: hypothetical protein QN139_05545, partial [Armatimonadota bacterium]|nr:hypothetical protein [Armatimonadota bacterium]
MFLGHYGAAFAVRPAAPRLPLGTCVLAAQWADLLWPALLLAGVERVRITPGTTVLNPLEFIHYPVSHSLLALVGWGVALGGLTWWRRRALADGVVIAALVVSHWVLDLFVHRPDLPVWPGSPPAGLGLW